MKSADSSLGSSVSPGWGILVLSWAGPAEDGVSMPLGPGRLNSGDREGPPESHPGRESERDWGKKAPRNTHHLRRSPRLFCPARLPLVFPSATSGARRCLIVRDWEAAVPRPSAHQRTPRSARLPRRPPPPAPPLPPSQTLPPRGNEVSGVRSVQNSAISSVRLVSPPPSSFSWIFSFSGKSVGGSLWFSTGRHGLVVWARQCPGRLRLGFTPGCLGLSVSKFSLGREASALALAVF